MRVIKFFGWEQALGARIEACRARELGRLWVIKYLDAACVYLWAALPVVISIVIFITYVLMGHQLTATKVRTRNGGMAAGRCEMEAAAQRPQWSRGWAWILSAAGKEEWRVPVCLLLPLLGKFSEGTFHLGPWIYDPSLCEGIASFPLLFLSNFQLGLLSLILMALGEKFMIHCWV